LRHIPVVFTTSLNITLSNLALHLRRLDQGRSQE